MTLTPAQKKRRAIQESLTAAERDLIKFYELQYFLRSRVPTPAEVTTHLRTNCKVKRPQLRQTSVNYYLTRAPVRKALKDRGIPFEQHTIDEITDQQQAAALTVANFADKRSLEDKLDQLGILPATYFAWLNNPAYRNFVQALADQNLANVDPIAKTEFVKKVQAGEWNAIKFYMEATGTLKNNDTPQSEIIIMKLIEILQRHVDSNTLQAISNEMVAAFSNHPLNNSGPPVAERALVGELVEDPELASAKKQLGFG